LTWTNTSTQKIISQKVKPNHTQVKLTEN